MTYHALKGLPWGVQLDIVKCICTMQHGRAHALLVDRNGVIYNGKGRELDVERCNEATKRAYAKLSGMTYKQLQADLKVEADRRAEISRELEIEQLERDAEVLGYVVRPK